MKGIVRKIFLTVVGAGMLFSAFAAGQPMGSSGASLQSGLPAGDRSASLQSGRTSDNAAVYGVASDASALNVSSRATSVSDAPASSAPAQNASASSAFGQDASAPAEVTRERQSSTALGAPVVSARFAPDSIAIGDHFKLEVTVDKDVMQGVAFPDFDNGMFNEAVEILSESGIDTISTEGRQVRLRKEYTMTTFEDGHLGMGRFPVLYVDKNITDTIFSTDSLFLKVATFEIDTATMQIRDIKQPILIAHHPYEYLGYVGAAILLALLAFVLIKLAARRKNSRAESVKLEPPHIVAIKSLEALYNQKLWQKNRYKLYYTRLTDILREYIERRFGVNAMEMTSEEIIVALRGLEIPEKNYREFKSLLENADLVKFAKYEPEADYNEQAYQTAYYFVEETKQSAEPVETDEKEMEGSI